MAALLDALHARTAIVGGLSLGGYMSLAFHRAHPERVKALLIIDTGPGFRNAEAREGWNRYALETADRLEKEGLAGMPGASPEVRASHHRSAEGLVRAARGMLTQRDAGVIESLPSVAVPTLVIAGADDKPFLNATEYMAVKIPGAQKVIIPNAGHAVNLDQREAFNAAVLSFLDRLEMTPRS
jgi:pimeloyl-ACP methyl ester carboxylesterase